MKKTGLAAFLCFTLSLQALTLDEAVQTALNNSVEIKKISMDVELAKENIKEKKASHYGRVDFQGSYTHYNLPRTLTPLTPASMVNGAAQIPTTQDIFVAGVAYNVNLFTGMSDTHSIEIANLQKEMAKNITALSSEQIIYNVKTLYTNILALNAQIDAQQEYVEALKKLHEDIELKVKLETLSRIDELKSLAELNHAKNDLKKITTNRDILKESLATLMFVDTISNLEPIDIKVDEIPLKQNNYKATLMQSKKLTLSKQSIQKSIKQEQIASASYYPKVALNAYYGQSAGYNDATNPKPDEFNHEQLWQIGIDLKWNIFDFGKTSSLTQKSKIATLQAQLDEAQTKRELTKDLKEALSKIELAISSYKSAQSELSLMEETQKIEQIRYDNGASDINDLLYTKARYQLAHSGFINARYEYQNAIDYLNYILEKGNK